MSKKDEGGRGEWKGERGTPTEALGVFVHVYASVVLFLVDQ